MEVPLPSWTSVRKLFINIDSSLPDLCFARRFCVLVLISAFITSQGDFTTTQRIVDGFSSLVGIDQKTRWKYLSIMLWKASEFGIGWWLDCTGPEVASLALLCYLPITYVLASASTFTSVSSLLVNILATAGPYYFLQQKPLIVQPPRRRRLDRNSWWLRLIYSAVAAVLYSLAIHKAAAVWVLPQIRRYLPLARQVIQESDLNWKWLLCSTPFLSIAVWNLFHVPYLPHYRSAENIKDRETGDRPYCMEHMRVLKRISVVILLSLVLTWVQLKAKSELL
ncbi:hypothetical protein V496_00058 [Pseudogymnoascus sp. VKM F-4515 (FW-2607)]|nr:hypothetical protein V496_00058 [Pseudogymnoascus sp. VKM F-4515 (FW-2607)]